MIHDQHIHTSYSRDSKVPIDEYYKIANDMGCKYFVCTDHIEFMSCYNHIDWTVDYPNQDKDLERLSKKYPNVIPLKGIEMGYRRDQLDRMKALMAERQFDLVNLSIHDTPEIDYYFVEHFKKHGVLETLDIYFNNMIDGLVTWDDFNVLSHFDYGFKTAYLIDNTLRVSQFEAYLKEIFSLLITKKKALEINIKVQETINDIEHTKYFLNLYKSLGGSKITISSDAHSAEAYLKHFDKYAKIAKECGFNEVCYFVKRMEYRYQI